MKALIRIAAVLSFGFFFAGGALLLGKANETGVVVAGLFFIGTAFFVGPILLAAAEKFGRKDEAK